jgi:FemAB-related protein (PEP-CTERM system-associated)
MNLSVARYPAAAPAPRLLDITSDVPDAEWDRFVRTRRDASGYHLSGWRGVFEGAFGHETAYLAAREYGAIIGILPLVVFRSRVFGNFAVSLPFVNYGGVLAEDDEVAQALVARAGALAEAGRLSHVELRHTVRQMPQLPARTHKVTMRLALGTDAAKAWEGLDRKVRNQVRKAEKSGLTWRRGGVELLDRFYAVFAQNMRDLGTPVYSRRFFEHVLWAFPATASVCLVDHGDRTVAGAITLAHRDVLEVPWASSLREYRSQCPNNLLYWRIIEHAIVSGRTSLDFGRSTPNEGTFHFKEQWGAKPEPLYWEYVMRGGRELPDLSPANPKYRAAIAVWTRLPLAVTNFLGPHIVKSIP